MCTGGTLVDQVRGGHARCVVPTVLRQRARALTAVSQCARRTITSPVGGRSTYAEVRPPPI